MSTTTGRVLALLSTLSLWACTGTDDSSTPSAAGTGAGPGATSTSAASNDAASTGAGAAGTGGAGDGGGGAGPVNPCGDALLCEKFEDYPGVTTLADNQQLGAWRAALDASGAAMDLDGTHTVSGSEALHMRIETDASAGGRLFLNGDLPIFKGHPTHVYGRMMMYLDPNGSSVHWTFFGASGDAEPSSPVAGRRATYLMSSLPKQDVNTYSFVYGLEASGGDPYHDCWFQSDGSMPTAAWTCVAFEMDSVARKLQMSTDGAPDPTAVVDDHGQGCVDAALPGDSPWYGPAIEELYVGAWSFHPMVAPLEVWIDDLVVDTKPVTCPAP